MIQQFFLEKRPHNGLTYDEYFKLFKEKVANTDPDSLQEEARKFLEYSILNFQRSTRIHKTYSVDPQLKESVEKISQNQLWMLITENWCGDSAQNLPYIAEIAKLNPKINLRIILRDSNLDIIDLYKTNETRSIPKLVAFDEIGNELFQWGPRPKPAQELVTKLKNEGMTHDKFIEQLHLWYGKNRGKELENEFKKILGAE
jgi:hypothetical protein